MLRRIINDVTKSSSSCGMLSAPASKMEEFTCSMSDTVLFRKLYAKIMARQIRAENRVHQLMMLRKGINSTFDEHLVKVREKVEHDGIRVQKLGQLLTVLDKNERTTTKDNGTFNTQPSSTKTSQNNQTDELLNTENTEPKVTNNLSASLFKIDGLQREFSFAEEKLLLRKFEKKSGNCCHMSYFTETPKEKTHVVDTQYCGEIHPNQLEFFADNSSTSRKLEQGKDRASNVLSRFENFGAVHRHVSAARPTDYDDEEEMFFSTKTPRSEHYSDCPKKVSFVDVPSVIADTNGVDGCVYCGLQSGGRSGNWVSDLKGEDRLYGNSPRGLRMVYRHHGGDETVGEPCGTVPQPTDHISQLQSSVGYPQQFIPTKFDDEDNLMKQIWPHNPLPISKNVETSFQIHISPDRNKEGFFKDCEDTAEKGNCFNQNKEHETKFTKWLKARRLNAESKNEKVDDEEERYQDISKTRRNSNFIADDALLTMRRQSWLVYMGEDPGNQKRKTIPRRLSAIFRWASFKIAQPPRVIIKGDKQEFNVQRKIRRKMSLRPLPDSPSEVALDDTADTLDDIAEITKI